MDDSRIKTAREVLSAFFDEEKLRQGGRYAEFFSSWKFLVGEQLAAHSHIADIKNGILYIEAEHPGWIQLLQLRQSAILAGIATRFPEFGLRGIGFRLGSPRPAPRPSEGGRSSEAPGPAEGAGTTAASAPGSEPEAAALAGEASPTAAGSEDEALREGARPRRRLEEIQDPTLKALLSSLKESLEGEKD